MTKNKLYIISLFLLVMSLAMVGCGKKSEEQTEEVTETVEEPVAEELPQITQPLPENDPEPVEPVEPVQESWFDKHDLTITPQGDFTFETAGVVEEEKKVIEVGGKVSIEETTEGCADGYKRVICDIVTDYSCIEQESGYAQWVSAFDRYTGTTFEFAEAESELADGDSNVSDGAVKIKNGDEVYDISIGFEEENDYPRWHDVVTVICPVEYDGTVFQIGYWDSDLAAKNSEFDYALRTYAINELPAYDTNGHKYYYFSYTDK